MNFSKPTKDTAINAASGVIGAGVGVGSARGAESYYPKEKNARMGLKAVIVAATILGASAINSDDALSQGAKGLIAGFGGQTGVSLVKDAVIGTDFATEDSTDKPMLKFAQVALGLKEADCGCTATQTAVSAGGTKRIALPKLNGQFSPINMVETSANVFEANRASILS